MAYEDKAYKKVCQFFWATLFATLHKVANGSIERKTKVNRDISRSSYVINTFSWKIK